MSNLARTGQPVEQEAAQAYVASGRQQSVIRAVAEFVLATEGAWFNSADVHHLPGCGLAAGRRLRELRTNHGWEFEQRRLSKNTWQFRLTGIPDDFEWDNL